MPYIRSSFKIQQTDKVQEALMELLHDQPLLQNEVTVIPTGSCKFQFQGHTITFFVGDLV